MAAPLHLSSSLQQSANASGDFGDGFSGSINFSGSKKSQQTELLMLAGVGVLILLALRYLKKA